MKALPHLDYLDNTLYAEIAQLPLATSPHLPSCLNRNDKSEFLEVRKNNEVYYKGPGAEQIHAGTVRSNSPIPPECGIYYYEMRVISEGRNGYIGIGFCGRSNSLNRLPGWDLDSWGYHGDDGKSFGELGQGTPYGPKFTKGDVVGCGVDMSLGKAFFTKNGVYLGVAFDNINISISLYPCFGLNTPGEHVAVNFGQTPFVFEINNHVQKQRADILRRLRKEWNS